MRSWPGVSVTRVVVPCFTDATNTSPRTTNATSSPSGDGAISVASLASTRRRSSFTRADAGASTAMRRAVPPAGRTQMPPSKP